MRNRRLTAAMMAVVALSSTPAVGVAEAAKKSAAAPETSQYGQGMAAYNSGDYATTYRLWKPLADQGDAGAQYNLGDLYDYGQGVPQDYAQAAYWYRKAADQGYAPAQNNLGVLYDVGHGVPQDYAQAAYWYRKAADQGYAPAQINLGFLYEVGQGVPQDHAQAAYWYRKAADQGVRSPAVLSP